MVSTSVGKKRLSVACRGGADQEEDKVLSDATESFFADTRANHMVEYDPLIRNKLVQGWSGPGGGQGLGPWRARPHRAPAPGRSSPAPAEFEVESFRTSAFCVFWGRGIGVNRFLHVRSCVLRNLSVFRGGV